MPEVEPSLIGRENKKFIPIPHPYPLKKRKENWIKIEQINKKLYPRKF